MQVLLLKQIKRKPLFRTPRQYIYAGSALASQRLTVLNKGILFIYAGSHFFKTVVIHFE